MTRLELQRALGALCLMGIFGSTFVTRRDDDEHDERKSRTRMVFTATSVRSRDTTLPINPIPGA